MTLERGTLLRNRYRIEEILGEGGMGAVYKARDENLGVMVAVKENLFTTEEYARQFRVEATILASIRHPNLTRVTDHFEEGESQYLVMDFIEGEDLRDRMERLGTLEEEEVIVIGVAICEALNFLHNCEPPILHRDIKPGNVKISPSGEIYLVDFGLAKIVQGSQLTITGARAMTPGYSPPEQYGTARTDPRSDIYSLGATLYSALTGALPEDGLARAMKQSELTSLRKLNPKFSRRLTAAIEKALAIQPEERFQTAESFQKALSSARGMTRRALSRDNLTVTPPPAAKPDSIGELGSATDLSNENVIEKIPPFSTDSVGVEFSSSAGLDTPLDVIKPAEKSSVAPIPTPKRKRGFGCWAAIILIGLLVGGGTGFYFINPELASQALEFFISPSGSTTPANSISSTQTALALEAILPTEAIESSPTFTSEVPTPTNTLPATTTQTPTPSPTETLVRTEIPTQPVNPTEVVTDIPVPLVTPQGGSGQIAFASNRETGVSQIWLMDIENEEFRQITNVNGGACQPDWSPDGRWLVFISPCRWEQEEYPDASLFMIDVNGENLVQLTMDLGGDFDPVWSADGSQIAFSSLRVGNADIYLLNLDDKSVVQLTDTGFKNYQPDYSSDGEKIAFIGARDGFRVWIMDADGSNQIPFSRSGKKVNSAPVWSPDGELIIFTQLTESRIRNLVAAAVNYVDPADYREFPLIEGLSPRQSADVSPDGNWIVYDSWPNGDHDIYLAPINGEDLTPIGREEEFPLTNDSALDLDPVWRPVP